MDVTSQTAGLILNCRPGRENHRLVFEYSLTNPSERDIYVHDALPSFDRESKAASANPGAASIICGPGGDAIVGKFIPPMPSSLRPAVPITPLAHRLKTGETMERRLEVPEPLAETSPYLPDLLLRQYQLLDIASVVFAVGYWISGRDGFGVAPASYAEGMWSVVLTGGAAMAGTMLASQRFPTRGLQIFRRTDGFPRTLSGAM